MGIATSETLEDIRKTCQTMTDIVGNVLQPPPWMNQDYLQKSLRSGLSLSDLQVTECAIQPAVAVGDNYASRLFRVQLKLKQNGSTKDMSVIVKMLPDSESFLKVLETFNLFEVEARMLVHTLPQIYKLLKDVFPDIVETPFPNCLYHQSPPQDLLILADLREAGYRNANRINGLDLDHTLLTIRALAQMHAASLQLLKIEPEIAKQYDIAFWHESCREMVKNFVRGGAATLGEELKTWDIPEKYSKKMIALEEVILDRVLDTYKRKDNEVNVILHGDSWVNNMMYKYSGDKVESIKYIDFQLANYSSPLLDILYFLFTSPQRKVREQHLDLILQTYHSTFMDVLQRLKYDLTYPFEDFKKSFHDKLFFGLFAAIFVFPLVCASKEDAVPLEDMLSDTSEFANRQGFRSRRFKEDFKELLPYFEKHGVI